MNRTYENLQVLGPTDDVVGQGRRSIRKWDVTVYYDEVVWSCNTKCYEYLSYRWLYEFRMKWDIFIRKWTTHLTLSRMTKCVWSPWCDILGYLGIFFYIWHVSLKFKQNRTYRYSSIQYVCGSSELTKCGRIHRFITLSGTWKIIFFIWHVILESEQSWTDRYSSGWYVCGSSTMTKRGCTLLSCTLQHFENNFFTWHVILKY